MKLKLNKDIMEKVPRTHGAAWFLMTPDEGGEAYDPQDKKPEGDDEKPTGVHPPLKFYATYLDPNTVGVRAELIHRHDANPETGISQQIGVVEVYDRDVAGPILVWESKEGTRWCIDGHHRLCAAKNARHIVSSQIVEGQLISVDRTIPAAVFCEVDGWTIMQARKLGEAANLGGDLDVEFVEDLVDAGASRILTPEESERLGAKDGWIPFVDSFELDSVGVQILARDSKTGDITVKQRVTRADCVNLNNRVYPSAVVLDAARRADRKVARGLLPCSEFEHPKLVEDCSGSVCRPVFVDNHDRKTGAWIGVDHKLDADGWLWAARRVFGDTEYGKKVAAAIDAKKPIGISTRFFVEGKMRPWNGQHVMVADYMDIITFDDVTSPAVTGAGALKGATDAFKPLGHSVIRYLTTDTYLGDPFQGVNNNTSNPDAGREEVTYSELPLRPAIEDSENMNISELIKKFRTDYSVPGKALSDYVADGVSIVHHLKAAHGQGLCIDSVVKEFRAAFDNATMAGYKGGQIEMVFGSQLGGEVGKGWGAEIEVAEGAARYTLGSSPDTPHEFGSTAMHASSDAKALLDELAKDREEKRRKNERKAALRTAFDSHEEMKKEDEETKEEIKKAVKDTVKGVPDVASVHAAIDSYLDMLHKGEARSRKSAALSLAPGRDIARPSGGADDRKPRVTSVFENLPFAASMHAMLDMADDKCRELRGTNSNLFVDPDSTFTKQIRATNWKMLGPVLDDFAHKLGLSKTAEQLGIALDSVSGPWDHFGQLTERIRRPGADSIAAIDATTTQAIFNQPYILPVFIVEAFQDLTAPQFVGVLGPREFNETGGGFIRGGGGRFGAELRLPTYSYTDPSGWGFQDGRFDAGLTVPEGQGISPGNTNVFWLQYGVQRRRIATIMTWDVIKAVGHGPANMPLVALELWMMAAREGRTIDRALYNQMIWACYQFQSVGVTAEPYSTGNNLLPNNSVYNSSGAVQVNLNPTKIASATPNYTTDLVVTYAATAPPGQSKIIGACRLLAGGTNTNTSPYYGARGTKTIGPGPIQRPLTQTTYLGNGQPTTTTTFPVSVTVGGTALVQGEVTASGGIWSYPGGASADFAIDYENGLIVFADTVAGSAGVLTTSFTMAAYTYATNWDDFIADRTISQTAGLWGGGNGNPTFETYLSGLFTQIDATSARMGSSTNFVKPDLGLMNMIASEYLTPASIFYQWASPDKTALWTSPTTLAERFGVELHRHNTPWNAMSSLILLTRKGATRYAIDTPFMVQGPVTVQDSNGNPTGEQAFYGQEFSTMVTPMPTDGQGNILNCPSRAILLRIQNQGIGVF